MLHPLFAAAQELGLPVMLQAGGSFAGSNPGPSPVGHPSSYGEYEISGAYGAIGHLISVLAEGLLDRFRHVRLILSGFGAAWLPSVLWRMDDEAVSWRSSRRPSAAVAEQVRVTTWRLERSSDPVALRALLSATGVDDLLMYASGDGDGELPPGLDENALARTARETLRLPENRSERWL
jgi:predicted TIM-barrel fold metal-dependent hydrolase